MRTAQRLWGPLGGHPPHLGLKQGPQEGISELRLGRMWRNERVQRDSPSPTFAYSNWLPDITSVTSA